MTDLGGATVTGATMTDLDGAAMTDLDGLTMTDATVPR